MSMRHVAKIPVFANTLNSYCKSLPEKFKYPSQKILCRKQTRYKGKEKIKNKSVSVKSHM